MYKMSDLLDLTHTLAKDYLSKVDNPWEVLPSIKDIVLDIGLHLDSSFVEIKPQVWVHDTARIAETVFIGSPAIIGAGTEIRHCAFIRGSALIGEECVIGNSVEIKNVIVFDCVQVPHFNYVGDSILGYKSHLGAGAIISNIKADKTNVVINGEEKIDTGLRKMGAIVGDYVEIGCNCVLNPGTMIGRYTTIYPLSNVRGVVPPDSIYKKEGVVVLKK